MKERYEIDLNLIMDKTLSEIQNTALMIRSKGGSANAGVNQKVGIACLYVWNNIGSYNFTADGMKNTLRNFYDVDTKFGEEFICIHRSNYISYMVLDLMYNWMAEKKMATLNVNRYWKKIHKMFTDYQAAHRSRIDQSSFMTVIDHERIAFSYVEPRLEPLEVAVRDYLIQHRSGIKESGQKDDITLLTKTYVGLMFCASLRNTQSEFFERFEKAFGIDFTTEYKWANINDIGRNFVWMMEQLGIKFVKDKDGDIVLKGVNVENSCRVQSEWKSIVNIVTDEELMDETALQAINLNPKTKADYERVVAEAEEQMLVQAMGDLSSKFKVSSL